MAKKILLADDSITIQKVVELTFSDGDFEVIAVNNGAKAIQKLQESRPDIVLSDIIMPEKNGYEVCEFVKSHPEFRNIPVILLTGTFEPFDPDRAERAGCDAVVTKPFESQSLIHKVEELIQQFGGSAAPSSPSPEASPFDETKAERRPEPRHESDTEPLALTPSPEEIFGAPEPSAPETFSEAPSAPFGAEELPAPPADDRAGADEEPQKTEPQSAWSAATTAFPKMSFDDIQKLRDERAPEPEKPASAEDSALDEQEEKAWSAETTALPKMTLDELREMKDEVAPPPSSPEKPAEKPRWPEMMPPPAFDELPKTEEPELAAPSRTFPWESSPEGPEKEDLEWPRAAPAAGAGGAPDEGDRPTGFGFDSPPPDETIPFTPPPSFEPPSPEPERAEQSGDDLSWNRPASTEPAARAEEPAEHQTPEAGLFPGFREAEAPAAEPSAEEAQPASASAGKGGPMTDEDIDRIARRVIELLSDKAVRDIAWEVIPDLAESIVRDRIKQLENQD